MSILRIAVAVLVMVVWAAVMLEAYVVRPGSANPPPELSAIAFLVATWLFGAEVRKQLRKAVDARRNGQEGNGDK